MSIAQLCALSYTLQLAQVEQETVALIGVIATARIQGAEIDIPTLAEARAHFNRWLLSDDDDGGDDSDSAVMLRALGLGKG